MIASMACGGLWAQDAAFKMIPADCLFCVRINNLDQTLGQFDQFLAGTSPVAVGMMAKMQMGQGLGNPMLTGVKTDGTFVVFATVPAEVKGPEDVLQGLVVLVPIADYGQFTASSPKIGKADADGVSQLADKPVFVTNLGSFAMFGPANGPADFAAKAKAIKAGPAKSLVTQLDAAEAGAATSSPIWIYASVPVLAKVIGPGVADKIRKAGEDIAQGPAGQGSGTQMKAFFDMYAGMADTLLKEMRSVTVTLTPKPTVLLAGFTAGALPGTSMSDALTKPSASTVKDWTLLPYCEDGAFMTGVSRCDVAWMSKFNLKMIDLLLSGSKVPADQIAKSKALAQEMPNAVGNELAFSATADPKAQPFFSVKYILTVKDKDKMNKLYDQGMEMYAKDGLVSKLYANMGLGLTTEVKRQPDSTYQGATIKACKLVFSSKDPNSPEAQMIQKMYGEGFDVRMAIMDRLAFMCMGSDSEASIKKLIDQAKAGGPKEIGNEMKAAMPLLPDVKTTDAIVTLNYLRILGAFLPAMSPVPMPQPNFQTKNNLAIDATVDKGKAAVQVALPKEHLTEIVQAVTQVMMQTQQQQQPQQIQPVQPQPGSGPKPQGM
jgi:hypothetical protein